MKILFLFNFVFWLFFAYLPVAEEDLDYSIKINFFISLVFACGSSLVLLFLTF